MRLEVVSDERGNIISIGKPDAVGDESYDDQVEVAVPLLGQQVHEIELPRDLEKKSLLDIHKGFRLDLEGERPRLVRVEDASREDGAE